MRLFYIDEFGDDHIGRCATHEGHWTLAQGASDLFVLAAVGIQDTSRLDLAGELRTIKGRYFPDHLLRPWGDTELKGRFLNQAGSRLASGKAPLSPPGYAHLSKAQFGSLVFELSRVWRRFRPEVFAVVIDKRVLISDEDVPNPVALAYALLQQRLTLQVSRAHGRSEGVLLIADEQTTHERYFHEGTIHDVRSGLSSNLEGIEIDYDVLLDKPLWIDPSLSTVEREVIQLADLAAYTTAQFVLRDGPPTEKHLFWKAMRPCYATHWNTGRVTGGGLTIYPKPSAYPPGLAEPT